MKCLPPNESWQPTPGWRFQFRFTVHVIRSRVPELGSFGAFMKPFLLTLALAAACSAGGQEVRLPPGFPDPLRTLEKGPSFLRALTTDAYTKEARRLLLQEASTDATRASASQTEVL